MNSKKAKRIIEDDVDLNIAELAEAVPEYKKKNITSYLALNFLFI